MASDMVVRPSDAVVAAADVVGAPSDVVGAPSDVVVAPTVVVAAASDNVKATSVNVVLAPNKDTLGLNATELKPAKAIPASVRPTLWHIAFAQDSAIRQAGAEAVAAMRPASASRLPELVATQRRTLALVQHQLDSLKAALPAEPPALLSPDSAAPVAALDSARRAPALPPLRRWSAALLAEATSPWGALPTTAGDTREAIGGARQVSAHVEHRLPNDRWLVRGGFGRLQLSGTFRGIEEKTGQRLTADTSIISTTDVVTNVDTIRIIHLDSVLRLNPRINGIGQIIGYDSLWAPNNDTIYQQITSYDSVQRTTAVVTGRLDTWRERREQQLRPTYRLWTIPVAAQFDVVRRGRWRAGLSAGAQVLIFRGGDQPTRLPDGTYALRRVGPRGGPFRPVSVALSAGLAVRYRLTDRLSLLADGGLRGWVQNPVRGDARRLVQPTGQVGVSWGVGGK